MSEVSDMNSFFYLLNLKISGIKSLEKEIRLDFYKKKVTNDFNPDRYRVKAIYGENGSGKTGIVTAVQILKELLTNRNYLNESSNQVFLNEIVNKKTQSLCITCEFVFDLAETIQVYKYNVELSRQATGEYEIIREKLLFKNAGAGSTTYKPVFEITEKSIVELRVKQEARGLVESVTTNLLGASTLNSILIKNGMQKALREIEPDFSRNMMALLGLGVFMRVFLPSSDEHDMYFLHETLKEPANYDKVTESLNEILARTRQFSGINSRRVPKDQIDVFEEKIQRLSRFLQLFKTDIQSIDIEKQENVNTYECDLLLNYGDYRVHTEFESTGIKKLIRLFDALNAAAAGDIVFIDEMDANINDIYLTKLIEYFMLYGKGQLCFTTHNTSPMAVLMRNKKSIDFLSNDNQIIPWRTNGHYTPESLYRKGMIQYLPFNVEPEDFIGILRAQ
ncbi:MAG: ATP-binding protein [Firmicutes bacterium]|nr:ATP-binding protein [Bacillota bacterium]